MGLAATPCRRAIAHLDAKPQFPGSSWDRQVVSETDESPGLPRKICELQQKEKSDNRPDVRRWRADLLSSLSLSTNQFVGRDMTLNSISPKVEKTTLTSASESTTGFGYIEPLITNCPALRWAPCFGNRFASSNNAFSGPP